MAEEPIKSGGRAPTYTLNGLMDSLGVPRARLVEALELIPPAEDAGKGKRWTIRQAAEGLGLKLPQGRRPRGPQAVSEKDTQDARLKRVQADRQEILLAKARGEVVPTEAAARVLFDILMAVRAKILQLPTKAAPGLVGLRKERLVMEKLEKRVNEVLIDVSNIDPEHFTRELQRLSGGVGTGIPVNGPASETDGERVGGQEPDIKP